MSKQDRNGVRTAQDLERKYNFQRLEKAIKLYENAINREENILDNFIFATVGSLVSFEGLKDGNITTYYYSGVPTIVNVPASEWTPEEYENHVDDIYYDKATGYAYRFSLNEETGEYEWVREYADYVIQALAIANSITDTADGKRRVFTEQPKPPYENGDMWFENGEVYICQISKPEDGVFEEDDFIIAPSYTDDTLAIKVNNALKVMQGTVSIIRAGQDKIEAKVDDALLSISPEAIRMLADKLVVKSDNLEIDEDGTLRTKKGEIGGFVLADDVLTADDGRDAEIYIEYKTHSDIEEYTGRIQIGNNPSNGSLGGGIVVEDYDFDGYGIYTHIGDVSGGGILIETEEPNDALHIDQNGIARVDGKAVRIDGREYGVNKVLWSGSKFLDDSETVTLNEAISEQSQGVIFVFGYYTNGAYKNYNFQHHFLGKHHIANHMGMGVDFDLNTTSGNAPGHKYLYISDTTITGHTNNSKDLVNGTYRSYVNNAYVLRYVIGV